MKLSTDQVDEKLIGQVMFEGLSYIKMKETLLNGKFKLIEIIGHPTSLISLQNGNFVCGTGGSVKLLDENFKEIKSVSTGGYSFCALNHRNEIYVSVYGKHCIFLYDLNFNELKQFGSEGDRNHQLKYPFGLCCHGHYLYICDIYNERIQILSLDFDYVSTIQLDGNPRRVQTSETIIGVSCDQATFFYDLKTRALKFQYNDYGTLNINYIDSVFYGSHFQQKKFYFFNSDGNFIEEMAMNDNLSKHITHWLGGSLCRDKDNLYLVDYMKSKILKFIQ